MGSDFFLSLFRSIAYNITKRKTKGKNYAGEKVKKHDKQNTKMSYNIWISHGGAKGAPITSGKKYT